MITRIKYYIIKLLYGKEAAIESLPTAKKMRKKVHEQASEYKADYTYAPPKREDEDNKKEW